jgi:hypothetical protein
MQERWYNIVRAGRNSRYQATAAGLFVLYISCNMWCGTSRGGAHNTVYIPHSVVDSLGRQWIWFPTHPPGVRAMAWLTGSVQGTLFGNWPHCLYICTIPALLVPGGLKAAQLPATSGVCPSLPPFPLSISLRFSLPVSAWATYTAGREVGPGSWIKYFKNQISPSFLAGTTTLCQSQLYTPARDYEFGYWSSFIWFLQYSHWTIGN